MICVLPKYWETLKKRFTETPEHKGYDPDEDPGYFEEFLVETLYAAEQERDRFRRILEKIVLYPDCGTANMIVREMARAALSGKEVP